MLINVFFRVSQQPFRYAALSSQASLLLPGGTVDNAGVSQFSSDYWVCSFRSHSYKPGRHLSLKRSTLTSYNASRISILMHGSYPNYPPVPQDYRIPVYGSYNT